MRRVIAVTGGAGGIGRAVCRIFAVQPDTTVLLHYHKSRREAEALEKELKEKGCDVRLFQADLCREEEVVRMAKQMNSLFGHVDVLVNNAAVAGQKLLRDVTAEEWDHMFAVNVRGAFLMTRQIMEGMIEKKRGRIINVSSIWGICGASCEVCYSASKAALIGMTKALAKEVGPSGITVNCVAPGVIDTRMNQDLDDAAMEMLKEETPLERIGTPEDVAASIAFLASEAASFITGQVISPNGGILI